MNKMLNTATENLFADDPEIDFRIKNDTERYRKGFATIEIIDSNGEHIDNAEVSLKLKKHEFKFGCNAFMYEQFEQSEQNAAYAEKFKELFNLAVVPFYWSDLEPEDGKIRFTRNSVPIYRRPAPDLLVEYCQKNNITPKGHPLLWHSFYPEWLNNNPSQLTDRIEQHFQEIAERYRDSIKMWDVINEVLAWDPQLRQMPKEQIKLAFKLAEKYFSSGTTLIYNEVPWKSWNEFNGCYTPLYLLVEKLLKQGLKVDCLGLQYHIFADTAQALLDLRVQHSYYKPTRLYTIMDQYAKLNIPFNISEITIPGADDVGGDDMQAKIVERLYRIWFSHPANSQIIWWNLVDGTAAYAPQGSNEGENKAKAGLLNYNFTHKPAYDVIKTLVHNEWTTNTTLKYTAERVNKFHGFYGDYDVIIKTNQGEFKKEISMHKGALNKFKLELK